MRIPLGAGADLVEAPVRIATVARQQGDAAEAVAQTAAYPVRRIDECLRGRAVFDRRVTAVDGGPPARIPDMLVERDHVPHRRQLDLAADDEDAVGRTQAPSGAGAGLEIGPID